MSGFDLDARLAGDTVLIGDLALCRVLLMNDSRYPWVILVPRRTDVSEIDQLAEPDAQRLWQETRQTGRRLMRHFAGDKLNIAALGNVVAQLHVHLIVRFRTDAAWPGPVWGAHPAIGYDAATRDALMTRLQVLLID